MALEYHFLNRAPEVPGSRWEFTYGKHAGKSLEELPEEEGLPETYDEWTKRQGIGTKQNPGYWDPVNDYDNDGKDDVAKALVYNERRKFEELLREYPRTPYYRVG